MSAFHEFRDSTPQAQDYATLRAIYDGEGYLFLRARLPKQAVQLVTDQLINEMVRQQVISADEHTAVHSAEEWPEIDDDAIHAHVDYDKLWHDPQTVALFEGLLGEAAWGGDLDELNVMLGAPGDEISSLRADKPTLLWVINWNAEAC